MISFDIDWYGTYNRRSAIADYLELLAMFGTHLSSESLADYLRDSGWIDKLADRIEDSDPAGRSLDEPVEDDTDLSESQMLARETTSDIVLVLRERADLLGTRYPFSIENDGAVVRFSGNTETPGPYLALLALTICHAAKVGGLEEAPAYTFEDTLTATLNARGVPTACLGRSARKSDFRTTLVECCGAVGLKADPDQAAHRTFANEEGCDTISNLWPDDPRPSGVQFIGQATCSRSNDWKAKLMEPPVGHWEDWIMRKLPPVAFLSVPHHVEPGTLSYLVSADRKRDVLDRVRLSLVDRPLLDSELRVIEALRTEGAELPV